MPVGLGDLLVWMPSWNRGVGPGYLQDISQGAHDLGLFGVSTSASTMLSERTKSRSKDAQSSSIASVGEVRRGVG